MNVFAKRFKNRKLLQRLILPELAVKIAK